MKGSKMLKLISIILVSYIIGSIPFGAIAARLSGGVDVTQYGSRKTGAANVLRTAGKKAAVFTGICDLAKGCAAVLLAKLVVGSTVATLGTMQIDQQTAQALAGLFVIVGHNYSVFLKFQGGSGVTSYFGALLINHLLTGLIGGGVVLSILGGTRYFSLGSMIGTTVTFVLMLVQVFLASPPAGLLTLGNQPVEFAIYTGIATALILFAHRGNMRQLINGTERKLGQRVQVNRPPGSVS